MYQFAFDFGHLEVVNAGNTRMTTYDMDGQVNTVVTGIEPLVKVYI